MKKNIIYFSDFINENNLEFLYMKELNNDDFDELLNNNCKSFKYTDNVIFRGDSNISGDFYYLNTKNRKVSYLDDNDQYQLHFLDKWDNLKKSKSSDFVVGYKMTAISSFYGELYRVIPFDNGLFATNGNKMTGNYNKKLYDDNLESMPVYYNRLFTNIVKKNNKENLNVGEKFNYIDYYIKNNYVDENLNKLKKLLIKRNTTLYDYFIDVFSKDSYDIMNYEKLVNSGDLIGWTDVDCLLIKYKLSKNYLKPKKVRIEKNIY